MVKRIKVEELSKGMYVCALEKEDGRKLSFMNNVLVRSGADVERFLKAGFDFACIVVDEGPVERKKNHQKKGHAEIPSVEELSCNRGSSLENHDETSPGPSEAYGEPVKAGSTDEGNKAQEEGTGPVEATVTSLEPADCVTVGGDSYARPQGETPAVEKALAASENAVPSIGEPATGKASSERRNYREDLKDFTMELKEAVGIRTEAENLVRDFMRSVREEGSIRTEEVHAAVGKMVDSIFRNQDALSSLTRLKSVDDYTFAHSVNVCIISLTIGRHMGLDKSSLHDLGVGGILHDIGKMLVPDRILKKPGALTNEETEVMKRHAILGAELVSKTRGISKESALVALQHHERYNGGGYPGKLSAGEIHLYSRIAAVADVYDAMTSNRVYQKGMKPDEALKKMYMWRSERFEPVIVERLIRCLGIYPTGTPVELNTGEVAVVRLPNHSSPFKPVVLMLLDSGKMSYARPFEADLMDDEARWIVASRSPEEFHEILKGLPESLLKTATA